jgi:hypothetical protein
MEIVNHLGSWSFVSHGNASIAEPARESIAKTYVHNPRNHPNPAVDRSVADVAA